MTQLTTPYHTLLLTKSNLRLILNNKNLNYPR